MKVNVKVNVILSLLISTPFSLVVFLILNNIDEYAFLIFTLVGLLAFISMLLFFTVYLKIMDKRYSKFEEYITSPVFYKTNGNFNLGNGKVKNGNIYFCEVGIVCVCGGKTLYA